MCYCTPSARTPFCDRCGPLLMEENKILKKELNDIREQNKVLFLRANLDFSPSQKAFEEWYGENYGWLALSTWSPKEGKYSNMDTELAWRAWDNGVSYGNSYNGN